MTIANGKEPLVSYVFRDIEIPRPYFKNLRTPQGWVVSREHPIRPGTDAEDHALLHPGLWLAFGDLNGQDFWRLKARVTHVRFVEEPRVDSDRATLVVENRYETTSGQTICSERCYFQLTLRENSWALFWDSTFSSTEHDLVFGDQEEMGLGVRLTKALTVKSGGVITNSLGQRNEKESWGKAADWCDYCRELENRRYGVMLMTHPENFKPSSFHTRDYGLMVANPFAEKAFGRSQQPAQTIVKRGEFLRLRFGVLVYGYEVEKRPDRAAEFKDYLKRTSK